MRRSIRIAFGAAALLTLVAAGPPRVGTELELGGGAGSYRFATGGCDTPRYVHRVHEYPAHLRITHRRPDGWTGEAELANNFGVIRTAILDDTGKTGPPSVSPGDAYNLGYMTARGGYHGAHGGITLGPVLGWETKHDPFVLVSGEGWLGVPDVLYGWGQFISGPMAGARLPLAAGLGQTRDGFKLELGVAAAESPHDQRAAGTALLDVRVTPTWTVGTFGAVSGDSTWLGMLRVGYHWAPAGR